MRKSEVEKSRNSFMGTGSTTSALKAKIQDELSPIANAHQLANQALDKIEALMQHIENDDKPAKAMRDLTASMKDAMQVMIQARNEVRTHTNWVADQAKDSSGASFELAVDVNEEDKHSDG